LNELESAYDTVHRFGGASALPSDGASSGWNVAEVGTTTGTGSAAIASREAAGAGAGFTALLLHEVAIKAAPHKNQALMFRDHRLIVRRYHDAMKYVLLATLALLGCGSNAIDGNDASLDSSATDSPAPKDQGVADSKTDAPAADAGLDSTADGGADAIADSADDAIADSGVDAVVIDSGSPVDGGCTSANDCKLFASYCSTAACKCLPLNKNDPNPICGGQVVQCFLAPCLGKVPTCSDAGTCAVGP